MFLISFVARNVRRLRRLCFRSWDSNEYFDSAWRQRISLMARYIVPGRSVLDLGCGRMWLEEFIGRDMLYLPVDRVRRDERTLICDFNRAEFPDVFADVGFVSGCLEYIRNPDRFVCDIINHCNRCIISYCTLERWPNLRIRKHSMWVNHLHRAQLVDMFLCHGMRLVATEVTPSGDEIFVFERVS